MSSQLPSSLTMKKNDSVITSLTAMTTMNNALGATPSRRLRSPKLADSAAKGTISFSMSSAPWLKGSKTGMRRYTASREKEDTDAMFEALKKADWMKKKKNREMRASDSVRERYSVVRLGRGGWSSAAATAGSTDPRGWGTA